MFRSDTKLIAEPLQQHRVGNARLLFSILLGAVGCLLLIACANVSNLLLGRWSSRAGEFAVRAAIGAGRTRLARQLFTEAVLLTVIGCALASLLVVALLRGFALSHAESFRRNLHGCDCRVRAHPLLEIDPVRRKSESSPHVPRCCFGINHRRRCRYAAPGAPRCFR